MPRPDNQPDQSACTCPANIMYVAEDCPVHGPDALPHLYPKDEYAQASEFLADTATEPTAEYALERARMWASGELSHMNEMQAMERSPEDRQQTLVAVAQADAAEAAKWSAYANALAQRDAGRRAEACTRCGAWPVSLQGYTEVGSWALARAEQRQANCRQCGGDGPDGGDVACPSCGAWPKARTGEPPRIMKDFINALGDRLYEMALRDELARKIYDAFEYQVSFEEAGDTDAGKVDAYVAADAVLDAGARRERMTPEELHGALLDGGFIVEPGGDQVATAALSVERLVELVNGPDGVATSATAATERTVEHAGPQERVTAEQIAQIIADEYMRGYQAPGEGLTTPAPERAAARIIEMLSCRYALAEVR